MLNIHCSPAINESPRLSLSLNSPLLPGDTANILLPLDSYCNILRSLLVAFLDIPGDLGSSSLID